ncbi:MAG TPA: molybdopterin molybdotransferase MoeA [Gammaproteobacteria bacterium]|nr:molybdopterin molybdotransferase MoeA [Gammaproteobacteria bacterium]
MADANNASGLDGLLSYEAAVEQLVGAAEPLRDRCTLGLRDALGSVLAEPVISTIYVPGWDYSAMDGYAVRSGDCALPGAQLPVSQRVPAGVSPQPLAAGSAARIFTGAPIPEGADAVVMQEECMAIDGGAVQIGVAVPPGANIRRRGEDITAGGEVVPAGTRLQPQHLGLAAAVGVAQLRVCRRPRVALFASGDELVMPGNPLSPGKIYNSNLFTATALLQALGCEVVELGIVEDTLEATVQALRQGAAEADLVLASGGVSVGEEDHVKPAVEALGSLEMWNIAIRPGKPVAFGHVDGTAFIGSPGNPVSLFVTFLLFVRPFILRMQGRSDWRLRPLLGKADFDWPKPDKRREFHRARLSFDDGGTARISVHPSRSSGVLSSVTWANGLAIIPERRVIQPGDDVAFLPFCELLT